MTLPNWDNIHPFILQLEQEGKVTRTFRRLDLERQQAVINAILEDATEKGPASLNIKEIARRAGVSVGSLYQYFPNRNGLLDFAIELCARYMLNLFEISRPYLTAMPLREALSAYLTVGVEWGKTEIGLVRFFGRAAYQGDPDLAERVVRPVAVAMRDLMREILAQAAERGEIHRNVDIDATARVINALMITIGDSQLLPYLNIYFQVSDENINFERSLNALLDVLENGLKA